MRVVIQRVKEASVEIDGKIKASINKGLLVLVGIEDNDDDADIYWLTSKIAKLRIFNNDTGVMDLSIKDIGGEILSISQFTLHAKTKKGNRPSYIKAAGHSVAVPLYDKFNQILSRETAITVKTGEFGADMKVALINDGPVTIYIDTKNKE